MNEQLQGKLVEILAGIQSATKAAGDFAMEQLPDIARQYVAYGRAIHTVGMLCGLLVLVTMFCYRKQIKHGIDEIDAWPVFVLMGGSLFSFLMLIINSGPFLLVWFAPKVWLLKELAGMLK